MTAVGLVSLESKRGLSVGGRVQMYSVDPQAQLVLQSARSSPERSFGVPKKPEQVSSGRVSSTFWDDGLSQPKPSKIMTLRKLRILFDTQERC